MGRIYERYCNRERSKRDCGFDKTSLQKLGVSENRDLPAPVNWLISSLRFHVGGVYSINFPLSPGRSVWR